MEDGATATKESRPAPSTAAGSKPALGASTASLELRNLDSATGDCLRRLGLRRLELDLNTFPLGWSRQRHRRIRETASRSGLELDLHLPHLLLDPVNLDRQVAEGSIAMMRALLKAAAAVGACGAIVHATWYHSTMEENIAALTEVREGAPLPILFENSFAGNGSSERDIDAALEELHVGLVLDVAHYWMAVKRGDAKSGFDDMLSMFGDRVAAVHLSDANGTEDLHLGIGAGKIPWERVLPALYERELSPWVIELRRASDFKPSLERVQSFLKRVREEGDDAPEG